MKRFVVFGLFAILAAVAGELAPACDPAVCLLPTCRCSGVDIPGNLEARDTPQFVMLTFDDAINTVNMATYRRLLYNRFNFNRCPIGVTYYINHEYTDYEGVNELHARGFEIALHSITHRTPQTFWRDATPNELVQEFVNQRRQMAQFANIPINSIRGIRMPFLQLGGNTQYTMLAENNFDYDASWPTNQFTDPGLWPYSLHYQSSQDCNVAPPCPNATIPGPWVLPMVSWFDLEGFPCSMADACVYPPDLEDEEGWYNFILKNFERHYMGNKAPFGVYIHEAILRNPAVENALGRFLNLINRLPDAFMVTSGEVLDWVKQPVPVDQYRNQNCRFFQGTNCMRPNTCPLQGRHRNEIFYLRTCSACPRVYPWVDNPLGA